MRILGVRRTRRVARLQASRHVVKILDSSFTDSIAIKQGAAVHVNYGATAVIESNVISADTIVEWPGSGQGVDAHRAATISSVWRHSSLIM